MVAGSTKRLPRRTSLRDSTVSFSALQRLIGCCFHLLRVILASSLPVLAPGFVDVLRPDEPFFSERRPLNAEIRDPRWGGKRGAEKGVVGQQYHAQMQSVRYARVLHLAGFEYDGVELI